MSNNANTGSNTSFSHAFLPGLILGLIVGGVAGAFLPDFLGGSKRPNFQTTPGQVHPGGGNGDPRSAPNQYDEETQRLIDQAMNTGKDAQDQTQDAANELEEHLEDAEPETTPPTPPSEAGSGGG